MNLLHTAPILAAIACLPASVEVAGAEPARVAVMISGGFKSIHEALSPAFEQRTGSRLVTVPGPSEGVTHDTIPNRLARGEPDDVLVMVGTAVRAGSPVPDVSTVAKLRQTLLAARSVAYSDSARGVYVQGTLFKKLGIKRQMRGRAHKVQATPVAEIVAAGKAEIGFQEVAELLPVQGATFAGRLPAEVELYTRYSAAVAKRSKQPDLAHRLVQYIASPDVRPTLEKMGLEPPKR